MAFLAENVRESIAFVANLFAAFLILVKVLITFLGLHATVRVKNIWLSDLLCSCQSPGFGLFIVTRNFIEKNQIPIKIKSFPLTLHELQPQLGLMQHSLNSVFQCQWNTLLRMG